MSDYYQSIPINTGSYMGKTLGDAFYDYVRGKRISEPTILKIMKEIELDPRGFEDLFPDEEDESYDTGTDNLNLSISRIKTSVPVVSQPTGLPNMNLSTSNNASYDTAVSQPAGMANITKHFMGTPNTKGRLYKKHFYTVKDIAELIGKSTQVIYNDIHKGKLEINSLISVVYYISSHLDKNT